MKERTSAATERRTGWTVDAVGAVALAAATFHPLCHLAFRCGCAWFFAGAADHCNMHDPAPPNCPPCTDLGAGALFASAILAAWVAVARAARAGWRRASAPARV